MLKFDFFWNKFVFFRIFSPKKLLTTFLKIYQKIFFSLWIIRFLELYFMTLYYKTHRHISYILFKIFMHSNMYFLKCLKKIIFQKNNVFFSSKTHILLSSIKRPVFWCQTWPENTVLERNLLFLIFFQKLSNFCN